MKIFIYIFCLFLNTTLQANSLEEALSLAYKKNPSIQAKRAELRSNDELVSLSSSEFFPKIRFIGSYGELVTNYKEVDEIRLRPNVTKIEAEQIIFSGGLNWSNIRKAQETNIRDKFQLIEAKRYVNQEVKSAFAQYNSSLIKVNSSKKQFEANQIALEGVKEEFELGTRTNLDVLDAEQEFLDSQVSMISSENNSKLSMFYLLLSIGSLSPEELSLPISKYDPNENYNKVKNIKLGWKRFKDIKNLD